jgi:DNA-binding transcriptional ArsR family regulator
VRPGPGSLRLLEWLARLGVAGLEPVALATGVSQRVVYDHVARLAAGGLVERKVTGDGEGAAFVLTRTGARVAVEQGVQGVVRPQSTAPGSARHGRAVSWVAASADLRGWRWLGPAELRAEPGWRVTREDGARHAPDLGLVIGGQRVAIEVELHRKAPQRLQAILRGYRGLIDHAGLSGVSYVVDRPDVATLVRREADAALLGSGLQIGQLEQLITGTREAGARRRAARAA